MNAPFSIPTGFMQACMTRHLMSARRGIKRVDTDHVDMFIADNFLQPHEQQRVIELIDENNARSEVAHANGDYAFRTSSTSGLSGRDPLIDEISHRVCALLGIDQAFAEPIQGQRYREGEEFKLHTDTFTYGTEDWDRYCSQSGQRTWTALIYLNDVTEGGETTFDHLGKAFSPTAGRLICWNNRHEDGSINEATAHHARAVLRGHKYVITQWFRELPWK